MSRHFSNEKSAFFFLLCIIFIDILPAAEPNSGFVPPGRWGRPLSPSEIAAYGKYKATKALESYNKRNAEIDSWIEDDAIPDYNNAALLYYQALLLQPDHDQAVINKFVDVCYGKAEPDTQIRTFLGKWLHSMKVSEIASRIPQCNWGIWPESVWPSEKTSQIFLMKSFRHFHFIIAADAITLASDGHYRAALERCMTLRRIARHLSYDSKLHLISGACDGTALRTIRRILGDMSLDADILRWLQGRLAIFQEATPFLEVLLQEYLKSEIEIIQSFSIARLRGMLLKGAADEPARQHIRDLTDEQIRSDVIEKYQNLYGLTFTILHSDKSAEQKIAEIKELTDYIPNMAFSKPLTNIYNELGLEVVNLIMGIDMKLTEEKKLDEIQRIIDKSEELHTIELLTNFSKVLGKEIDFSFIADSKITDEQKLIEMQKVFNELSEAFAFETATFGVIVGNINSHLERQVRHKAQINSTKAAVELYLIMAKTGQLPEELPDDLPKDPFTGLDFLYEITDNGFILGCRSDIFKGGKERFTFHVQKKSN